jgi:hypothetical protein
MRSVRLSTIVLFCVFQSACAEGDRGYSDLVTNQSGNATSANIVAQTRETWPRSSFNRNVPVDVARTTRRRQSEPFQDPANPRSVESTTPQSTAPQPTRAGPEVGSGGVPLIQPAQ